MVIWLLSAGSMSAPWFHETTSFSAFDRNTDERLVSTQVSVASTYSREVQALYVGALPEDHFAVGPAFCAVRSPRLVPLRADNRDEFSPCRNVQKKTQSDASSRHGPHRRRDKARCQKRLAEARSPSAYPSVIALSAVPLTSDSSLINITSI
jgi:hypothetical protein